MTTKARFFDYAVARNGANIQIVQYPTVTVLVAGGTDPIVEQLYDANDDPISNPFTGTVDGAIEFYLEVPKRVKIRYTGTGFGTVDIDNEAVLLDPGTIIYQGAKSLQIESDEGELIDAKDDYISLADGTLFVDQFANRVGINNIAPDYDLHVIGDFAVEDSAANKLVVDDAGVHYKIAAGTDKWKLDPLTGKMTIYEDIVPDIDSDVLLGSPTRRYIALYALQIAVARGAITAPSLTSSLETTTGFSFPSAGVLVASILTNEIWRIDADEFRTQVAITMLEQASLLSPGSNLAVMAPRSNGRWYSKHSGGSEKFFVESDQIVSTEVAGSTNNPTLSGAGAYEDLAEMTRTLTNCVAGDIIDVSFVGAFRHSTATAAIQVGIKHNSNAEGHEVSLSFPTANEVKQIYTQGLFVATAGTNTITIRWLTGTAATATANGIQRMLKVVRRPV